MPKPTKPKSDPLNPSLALLAKLGSIIVHVEEGLSETGHVFDRIAIQSLLQDPEVAAWLRAMGPFLPLKRF